MESERIKSVSLSAHWSLSIMLSFTEELSFSFQSFPFHYLPMNEVINKQKFGFGSIKILINVFFCF